LLRNFKRGTWLLRAHVNILLRVIFLPLQKVWKQKEVGKPPVNTDQSDKCQNFVSIERSGKTGFCKDIEIEHVAEDGARDAKQKTVDATISISADIGTTPSSNADIVGVRVSEAGSGIHVFDDTFDVNVMNSWVCNTC